MQKCKYGRDPSAEKTPPPKQGARARACSLDDDDDDDDDVDNDDDDDDRASALSRTDLLWVLSPFSFLWVGGSIYTGFSS